ncbi:protein phosphatase 2C domain-containing protein [Cryptosporangium aurantiacum]|uniref:Serine/threonine protein phosphatase PrpC n=1 Tax=Cryptosporangium aurantiacum TaxID=134849 RepID=A0A1M7RKJ6_9ACTN|nr:protein phosphatase 2C domain-containing protein [Cryptosporangium aurantiacum]SHN46679.1 Serine/threonine protein phosphatase PrpC [Cryptosporangium aurantiacum]
MVLTCPNCAVTGADADLYCEECGGDLRAPSSQWLSSAAPGGRCGHCGAVGVRAGAYCAECGRRRGAGLDRAELELPGLAAVTDRGHRKHHNEDAVAIGAVADGVAAVVCDGVSTTPRADAAATAAADTGLRELLSALALGSEARAAAAEAFRRAFAAVARLAEVDPRNAPSCTYVSGTVTDSGITIGWVGDSRAYWVPAAGEPRCLTVDDALPAAVGAPLVRWVGADAGSIEVQVAVVEPPADGCLVLCSDGLSRYLPSAAALAGFTGVPPREAARRLTRLALDAGGADNIAVAVLSSPVTHPRGASL